MCSWNYVFYILLCTAGSKWNVKSIFSVFCKNKQTGASKPNWTGTKLHYHGGNLISVNIFLVYELIKS